MSKRTYGYTKAGKPIEDEMIESFVDEAERGYDAQQLRDKPRGRGRPPLGRGAKVGESVRLEPDLRAGAEERAATEGVSTSELILRALREYLTNT